MRYDSLIQEFKYIHWRTHMTHTTSTRNSTEQKAVTLLGSGLGAEMVANACGVHASRISQLLSDPIFAAEVAELRFEGLQKHNVRDDKYDAMEDTLLERMKDLLPMMMRPMEILKAISVINSAKRRGVSAPEAINQSNTVVTLVMPKTVIQNFTTNINNQVIRAGSQELLTIQSGSVGKMIESARKQISTQIGVSDENGQNRIEKDRTFASTEM